jgi:hypothetical protein
MSSCRNRLSSDWPDFAVREQIMARPVIDATLFSLPFGFALKWVGHGRFDDDGVWGV